MRAMKALHKAVRPIKNPSEKRDNEYLVAMKTSTFVVPGGSVADFHFVRQLSDGSWADKPGSNPSRWNVLDGFAATWPLSDLKDYYCTDTQFFAVK